MPGAKISPGKARRLNSISTAMDFLTTLIPPWVLIAFVAFGTVMGSVAYLILLERKVASWGRWRLNRSNRFGAN